jgi:hypothetical protein
MSDEEHFALKSFSYLDPKYTRDRFHADIADADPALLPFRVTAACSRAALAEMAPTTRPHH